MRSTGTQLVTGVALELVAGPGSEEAMEYVVAGSVQVGFGTSCTVNYR